MITIGVIEDRYSRTVEDPFFAWLHALDLNRFNLTISQISPTVEHATQPLNNTRPDVWLLRSDSALKPRSLLTLCGESDNPLRPVVVVCDNDIDDVSRVLSQQVAAVVLINDSPWHLTSAIHSAAARRLFVSSQVLDQYRDQVVELITAPPARRLEALTEREHDVLICLAAGNSNSAIARELHITRATVGSHVLNILRKLNVANRTEATALAHQLGLVTPRVTKHRAS